MTNNQASREYPELDIDEYKAVQLQDYMGKFGLLSLDIKGGENTTYYKQWIWLSEFKHGKSVASNRRFPMIVRLGDRETAIKTLEELLRQLKG